MAKVDIKRRNFLKKALTLGSAIGVGALFAKEALAGIIFKINGVEKFKIDDGGKITGGVVAANGTYTGDGGTNRAVAHGMGVTPKGVVVIRNASFDTVGSVINGKLSGVANGEGSVFNVTAADSTNFYVGNGGAFQTSLNANATPYSWFAVG